jgi:hypothetical protein
MHLWIHGIADDIHRFDRQTVSIQLGEILVCAAAEQGGAT